MKRIAKGLFHLMSALLVANFSFAQDTVNVVTEWLKQRSIPIKYIEADNGFSDLQPLKEKFKEAQVIGLGEATHGTREFFQVKHRLVEFLVKEMGFTAFALESSYSNCEPINDYILTGEGDRDSVLTGQGYVPWDTEEFSAMLDWLKAHNQRVPDEKKVRFYGIDVLSYQEVGREKVLAYLQQYAAEKVASTDSLFRVLATEENNWPSRLDQSVLQSTFIPLHELISYFTANKDRLVSASSLNEWEKAFKYLEVMEQGLFVNVEDVPYFLLPQKLGRDDYMYQNLMYLMEKERPNTKFMFWAHNDHIANNAVERKVGHHLRQKFGDKYYGLALECNQGTFQARVLLPDNFWGDLKADTILEVQESVDWYLARTVRGKLFIDLRQPSSNRVVDRWLESPIRFGRGNWIYRGAKENFEIKQLKGFYDGILFIERSTPVHPTKNALARSAARIGF